jgi:hypothetical protein
MARGRSLSVGIALGWATLPLAGCYDVHTVEPGHRSVPIVADEASGWVHAESNPLGLAGLWYSYGDQYPTVPRCTEIGLHDADTGEHDDKQCSFVAWPEPWLSAKPDGDGNFPSSSNRLCTYGNVAKVNKCHPDAKRWCPEDEDDYDYANMWGAGIGFEFRVPDDEAGADAGVSTGWDAPAHGIAGVAFDLDWTDPSVRPDPFIRIEFPVVLPPEGLELDADTVDKNGMIVEAGDALAPGSTSEVHPSGSPFLNAPPVWATSGIPNDPSLVNVGHNEILWSEVKGAPSNGTDYAYRFHPENLIGLQFHVPAIKDNRIPYGFCISNLAFIRQ